MELDYQLFIQMAYALGIGLLIGLERTMGQTLAGKTKPDSLPEAETSQAAQDKADDKETEEEFLGLRTFTVLSLVGFAAALASERFPGLAPVVMAGVTLVVVATSHHRIG